MPPGLRSIASRLYAVQRRGLLRTSGALGELLYTLIQEEAPRAADHASSQQTVALLRLRELLLNGAFRPGQRMAELPLSKRLKVSRTPLRLALVTLEHEGLLELHPSRGFVTRSFSLADIYDAIDLRGVLEGMAGRLAVERLSANPGEARDALSRLRFHLSEMETVLDTLEADPDPALARYAALNDNFHETLLRLSSSKTLLHQMQRVTCLPFASPSGGLVGAQARLPGSLRILRAGHDQHHAIVEALECREATRIEALLREHARLSRTNLEIVLADHKSHHLVPALHLIKRQPPPTGSPSEIKVSASQTQKERRP